MNIELITISKNTPPWITDGYREYAKRLPNDYKLTIREITPEKRLKSSNPTQIKKREGENIMKKQEHGEGVLKNPALNRDTAFTAQQRAELGLHGLLPARTESISEQCARNYLQYQQYSTKLQKSVFLNDLHSRNKVLFYRLVSEHIEEMLPIIYTPTVGDLVMNYSQQLRRPQGLYLNYPDRAHMKSALDQAGNEVDLLVVTDGSAVLGIGDQGFGSLAISIGKLMVYTAMGGINPARVLPVVLDVGTDNQKLLDDPMYLGWRHPRLKGEEYYEFIEQFVKTVLEKFPNVLLHWEDFSKETSLTILNKYRSNVFTFNDDIQGTGGVTVACILTALRKIGGKLSEQKIVFHGAGSSAIGIAEQLVSAIENEGVTAEEARARIWLLNSKGLVTEESERLSEFQLPFARKKSELTEWQLDDPSKIDLFSVVKNVRPTILIGCSTVAGAFSEEIVTQVAQYVEYPIILPLSNPSSKSEALPEDLIKWTQGKALIATGSPFTPVEYEGTTFEIAQCNNAFVFPALALGAMAAKANRITDGMFHAASNYLSQHQRSKGENTSLLPHLSEYPELSKKIALAVAEQARTEGVISGGTDFDLVTAIEELFWLPEYNSKKS